MPVDVEVKISSELWIGLTVNCSECGSEMDIEIVNSNRYRREDNSIEVNASCSSCKKETKAAVETVAVLDEEMSGYKEEIAQLREENEQLRTTNVFNWLEDKLRMM